MSSRRWFRSLSSGYDAFVTVAATWRAGRIVSIAATLVLLLPAAAGAANIAPNQGFEANCGGAPCQWSARGFQGSATTFLHDTWNPHTGGASANLTVSGRFGSITSACVPFTGGPISFSFWYRTTDANATNLQYIPNYSEEPDCSGAFGASDSVFVVPIRDGEWHFSGIRSLTVPQGGPAAILLVLTISCEPCIPGGQTAQANFDDVVLETGGPTAVTVDALSARQTRAGVLVRWRTAAEIDVLGFNVYRGRVRLNRTLLPARGTFVGAAYRFLDIAPKRHRDARYRLEAIVRDGSARSLGTVRVTASDR